MTFSQEMKNDFIPALKTMLEKENKHYHYLLSKQYQFPEAITPMIERSEDMIEHLETRIKEYENFVAKY